jgi:hypothetical protein
MFRVSVALSMASHLGFLDMMQRAAVADDLCTVSCCLRSCPQQGARGGMENVTRLE